MRPMMLGRSPATSQLVLLMLLSYAVPVTGEPLALLGQGRSATLAAAPIPGRERSLLPVEVPPALPVGAATRTRVRETLRRKLGAWPGFHGCVLVARGEEIVVHEAHGMADVKAHRAMPLDALWDWASVTKQFTAAAVLRLQDAGKLRIDDPLDRYLPGAPADKKGITLRHLLTHTSGIDQVKDEGIDWGDGSRDAVVRAFYQYPMAAEPGTTWDYNNHAYFVLAAVVEKVSGRPYETFVIEELFRCAGMQDASFIGQPGLPRERLPRIHGGTGAYFAYGEAASWFYKGAGAALASVHDMWLWDRALRRGAVLSTAALAASYRPFLHDYALGWEILDAGSETVWFHGGSVEGVSAFYLRGARSQAVVAAIASDDDRKGRVEDLSFALYEALETTPSP